MGILTLAQLRSEITGHLGDRSDIDSGTINRAINMAQIRMCRLHDFREMAIRQTGVLTYTGDKATDQIVQASVFTNQPIDDVLSFVLYESGGGRENKLTGWSPRQLDKLVPNGASERHASNMPTDYIFWKEQFELFPVPDKAYNFIFRAYIRPAQMSDDGSTSPLEYKDDLIIYLATAYLYGRLGEYERMNKFFEMYINELDAAITSDEDNPDREVGAKQSVLRNGGFSNYWNDPFTKRAP